MVGYDATQDPEACRVILRQLLDQAWHREPGARCASISALLKVFGTISSRTSTPASSPTPPVMFGDVAMIKVFRRLELGRNLDIEVHDALSRSHSADVARLFGWVEAAGRETAGRPSTPISRWRWRS